MTGTLELTPAPGLAAACRAMGLWRGALGRHKARAHRAAFVRPALAPRPLRPRSPLALSEQERALVLQALCSERFTDTTPAAVHATLLDEGTYLGSQTPLFSSCEFFATGFTSKNWHLFGFRDFCMVD